MAKIKADLAPENMQHKKDITSGITERQGIILEQNKEPALSRDMRTLFSQHLETKLIRNFTQGESDIDIIAISKSAKIIDESSGRRLSDLLKEALKNKCITIVVDAIDDEPYISSQLAPALKLPELLARGVELAKEAIGAKNAEIEIYKNLFDSQIKIEHEIAGIPVIRVGGGYPAENIARHSMAGGVAVIGSCALIHLARAVDLGRVQTTCFVTVAGDCVATPVNLEVTMDKTLEDVLNFCGLMFDPSRVVVGGSMKGFSVIDLAGTFVTPMTRGVLAFKEVFVDYHLTCIGCGRCAEVCPQGLSPYYIYKFVTSKRYKLLKNFDIDMCINCGTCSYICPAKLNISTVITNGKQEMVFFRAKEEEARLARRAKREEEFADNEKSDVRQHFVDAINLEERESAASIPIEIAAQTVLAEVIIQETEHADKPQKHSTSWKSSTEAAAEAEVVSDSSTEIEKPIKKAERLEKATAPVHSGDRHAKKTVHKTHESGGGM